MGTYKFHRWDNALKQCMDAKKRGGLEAKGNRWRGDPLQLNREAHELPPEKQREAVDLAEEASAELRAKLAPMWKYCFVQWHVYDAGLEAIEKGKPLREGLKDEFLLKDIESLKALFDGGDLEKAKTAEPWTWQFLDPLPPAGTLEPWNDATAAPVLKVGRQERKEGVAAYAQGHYEKALLHCAQGLRLVARAPATVVGPQAKLRCDLYKNQAAAALKLQMNRSALRAANAALGIDGQDPKAWYRKSCALEALGRTEEAKAALALAGLARPNELAEAPAAALGDVYREGAQLGVGPALQEELPLRLHARLEPIVFIEVGIDSIAAVDMIMHLQAELPDVPIPLTLVFDCPTVEQAVTLLLGRLNAEEQDAYMRAKMNSTVWRSMCRALGTDPVQGLLEGRLGHVTWPEFPEQEARDVLLELTRAYEEEAFLQRTRTLAKRVAFEQRAFLVNLRALAMEVQAPILEARGFDADAEGLRRLECAVVAAAMKSRELRDLLQGARVAQQGGPNGMWAVNMEPLEAAPWADCDSVQSWSKYMRADPFGPDRKNTNSVLSRPALA